MRAVESKVGYTYSAVNRDSSSPTVSSDVAKAGMASQEGFSAELQQQPLGRRWQSVLLIGKPRSFASKWFTSRRFLLFASSFQLCLAPFGVNRFSLTPNGCE